MRGRLFLSLAAGALLMLGAASTAQADHRNDRKCFERVRSEQNKLERDIRRHGFFSRQAQHRRERLAQLRRSCGYGGGFFWRDGGRDNRWDRDRHRDGWAWRNNRWVRSDDWYRRNGYVWRGGQWCRR
jgi:type II secretory pathway component PulJ